LGGAACLLLLALLALLLLTTCFTTLAATAEGAELGGAACLLLLALLYYALNLYYSYLGLLALLVQKVRILTLLRLAYAPNAC
jgi:hypothetical protein